MALAAGTRLGPYEIVAALGAGGMGEVYQARDTRLDRTVAIKVLPSELSTDPERRARFEREARTIAALNHPHICTLHDVGEAELPGSDLGRADLEPSREPGRADLQVRRTDLEGRRTARVTFLVMEHLVGETLAQRLRKGRLPIAQALDIGAQIADALDAAHSHDIVHRDLKPSNVMLTANGAKLLDFGLAKLRGSEARVPVEASAPTVTESLTHAGEVLGTRPYMAPEQVEGKATDARTDLWALGCVLYEMVTGRAAFAGDSAASITAAILDHEPEPLAAVQPLAPASLGRLVAQCLRKRPGDRWASAHDVAEELRWIAQTDRSPRAFRRGRAFARRTGWRLLAAGLAVTAAVVAWGIWRSGTGDPATRDAAAARPPAPSTAPLIVAVLPFRSVAGEAQYAYLADGATEALINGLARVQGLGGVVASASARQAAGGPGDVRTAADRLGADRVVEGTSFGDATRVRFEVRLSDRQGRVLWSDRAEGAPDEILQVHETLVVRVAAALGQDLPIERRARIARIDPDAQRVLVQGLMRMLTSTSADPYGAMIQSARQALVLAPDYADAHRVLAKFLAETVYFGIAEGSQRAALDEAKRHADRAVELDPASGLAFEALASVKFVGGDREGAEADYRRALALSPGSGKVQWAWSWYLSHFGRYDECVAAGDRAAALDPLTPTNASGWCLFVAGRYAEAASRLEAQLVERGFRGPHVLLAATYARAGRVAEARALRDSVLKATPPGTDPAIDWFLIYVYLADGDRGAAQRMAEHWWQKKDKPASMWGLVAQMYGALDDVERVVECYRQAAALCDNPDPCYGGLLRFFFTESIFSERVRRDPRLLRVLDEERARQSPGA